MNLWGPNEETPLSMILTALSSRENAQDFEILRDMLDIMLNRKGKYKKIWSTYGFFFKYLHSLQILTLTKKMEMDPYPCGKSSMWSLNHWWCFRAFLTSHKLMSTGKVTMQIGLKIQLPTASRRLQGLQFFSQIWNQRKILSKTS